MLTHDSEKEKTKAVVFIDGANIFYTQKDLGWNLSWKKTVTLLKQKWEITEVRYYTGIKQDDTKMQGYIKYLEHLGIKVISKPLKVIRSSTGNAVFYKSNFDVEMAVDMILMMKNYHTAVLFSGDSDFDYLVKTLKSRSKEVWSFSSRKMISWELRLATEHTFLEDLKSEISR